MRKFKLVTTDNKILYEGFHRNLNQAIEYAVHHNVSLNGIDLTDSDLQHINLDGIRLSHACFKGANLSGANMSEAEFSDCDFSGSDLSNACMCYSNFINCNLRCYSFCGADISMSSLSFCYFEGFSSLFLDFHKAFKLETLTFIHFAHKISFSSPPTLIKQGERLVAIIDKIMIYNHLPHTFDHNTTSESILNNPQSKIQSMVDS